MNTVVNHKYMEPHTGFYTITPEMANFWLNSYRYKFQRTIRAYHVAMLKKEMDAGRFRQNTQINFCELSGEYHLVNGQHTLSALVRSGIPQRLCIVVNKVNDESEIADDFSRHDTHLTRRAMDSLVAHRIDEQLGISKTALQFITSACIYYSYMTGRLSDKSASHISNDEKLEVVMDNRSIALEAYGFFYDYHNKPYFNRRTTLASAMITAKWQSDMSHDFWIPLAQDDGLRKNDPRKMLLEYLKSAQTVSGAANSRKLGVKAVPDHALVKAIASCWNAFVERRELKIVKPDYSTNSVTFKICGTYRV